MSETVVGKTGKSAFEINYQNKKSNETVRLNGLMNSNVTAGGFTV